MAEALDTLELVAAPANDDDGAKFPLNDLPNDVLVTVFEAVGDLCWVRRTVPLVCKAWAELYRSQDASPLHETLEVDFEEEWRAARETFARRALGPAAGTAAQERSRRRPLVHASRVISWVERRAGSVRELKVMKMDPGDGGVYDDFSPEDVGRLVAVAASSLTKLEIGYGFPELCRKPFWESLMTSVAPFGRLRSLVVNGSLADIFKPDVEPFGQQLAGSLEELELCLYFYDSARSDSEESRLRRFAESLCALTELRRLELVGHSGITALPAQISSLKKLKELKLTGCGLSSLPKELGELSGLTKLDLAENKNLGPAPLDEAFPAELKKMKSLRELKLSTCDLIAVPAVVGELESLEVLDLSFNFQETYTTLNVLMKGCPRLREVALDSSREEPPWTPETRAHVGAFKAKLLAQNPRAHVTEPGWFDDVLALLQSLVRRPPRPQ